jgi:hypothetical protein
MRWDQAADEYLRRASQAEGGFLSLPTEWQRELVALCRAIDDVNNGAYLQFLVNHGRHTYVYASQAFKKIGAHRMAEIIDECQSMVDEHYSTDGKRMEERSELFPNKVIRDGRVVKEAGSVLPEDVVQRLNELSYEFMDFPDDVGQLGESYFGPLIDADMGTTWKAKMARWLRWNPSGARNPS